MRIVIISYSHHGESIGRECVSLGHEIVGVADQEIKVLEELKEKFPIENPHPKEELSVIMYKAGQRSVIEWIENRVKEDRL